MKSEFLYSYLTWRDCFLFLYFVIRYNMARTRTLNTAPPITAPIKPLSRFPSQRQIKNDGKKPQWNYLWHFFDIICNCLDFFCAIYRSSMKNKICLYRQPLAVSIETSFQSYPINYERSITYRSITNSAFHFYLNLKVTWIYDFHGHI